jgi:hypothetical protein
MDKSSLFYLIKRVVKTTNNLKGFHSFFTFGKILDL